MTAKPSIPVLPVIDLNEAAGSGRKKVAALLYEALTTVGFFYLKGVKGYDENELLKISQWYFRLAEPTKMRMTKKKFDKNATHYYRGYFPVIPGEVSHKEAFEIGPDQEASKDTTDKLEKILMETNQWPSGIDPFEAKFKSFMQSYYDQMYSSGLQLIQLLAEASNLPTDFFRPLFDPSHMSTLRLLHYPKRTGEIPPELRDGDKIIVTADHRDSTFFTFLSTFEHGGLQIRDVDNSWLDVPCLPGCLVVNIGALLGAMSDGRFKATNHRVVDIGTSRYSVPFFLEPAFHADVSFVIPPYEKSNKDTTMQKLCIPAVKKNYGTWVVENMSQYAEYRDILKAIE